MYYLFNFAAKYASDFCFNIKFKVIIRKIIPKIPLMTYIYCTLWIYRFSFRFYSDVRANFRWGGKFRLFLGIKSGHTILASLSYVFNEKKILILINSNEMRKFFLFPLLLRRCVLVIWLWICVWFRRFLNFFLNKPAFLTPSQEWLHIYGIESVLLQLKWLKCFVRGAKQESNRTEKNTHCNTFCVITSAKKIFIKSMARGECWPRSSTF